MRQLDLKNLYCIHMDIAKMHVSILQEKDLHSGLIGPLVICKAGTLRRYQHTQPDIQDFSLLFHTFDETKSWYLEENLQQHCAPPCQVNTKDPWYHTSNKFAGDCSKVY